MSNANTDRFVAMSIPGRECDDPASWFVFDTRTYRSEPAANRIEAIKAAKARNAKR